jgi:hypothetical protein
MHVPPTMAITVTAVASLKVGQKFPAAARRSPDCDQSDQNGR